MDDATADKATYPRMPRRLLLVVLVTAIVAQGGYFSASRLVVHPDSAEFIALGIGLAERLDFGAELFQFRPPVYPLLLAAAFRVFGEHSATAILAIQHLMIVGIVMLATRIAWLLRPSRLVAGVTGVLTATGPHLTAYANIVLTEALYALIILASLMFLVWHYRRRDWRLLAFGSLLAGLAILTKPTGRPMLFVCAGYAICMAWASQQGMQLTWPRRLRTVGAAGLVAIAPALILMTPVMTLNYFSWGQFGTTGVGAAYLYPRTRAAERLDSATSPSVAKINRAFEIARAKGAFDESVSEYSWWGTMEACRIAYGYEVVDTAKLMAAASHDLVREHFWLLVRRTPGHIYRMMAVPDDNFRFAPGGTIRGNASLPENAGLVAADKYVSMVRRNAAPEPVDRYLKLSSAPTLTSERLNPVLHWYDRRIGHGRPVLGILDTPYEEYMLLVYLGGLIALLTRPRGAHWVVLTVVAYHIGVSAALEGGGIVRYAVPMLPMFYMLSGLTILHGWLLVAGLAGRIHPAARHMPRTLGSDSPASTC